MNLVRGGVDGDAPFGDQPDDLGIEHVFHIVDLRLERVERIVFGHCNRALRNDRALIVIGVREMHRDARHLHACVKRVGDGVRALERRQERRVQVEHAIGERVEHDRSHLAHVARHDHVFRARFLKRLDDLRVGCEHVGVFLAIHHERGDSRRMRALDAVRVGARRHDEHDVGGQALDNRVDDRLQVRSAARKQHANLKSVGHVTALSAR